MENLFCILIKKSKNALKLNVLVLFILLFTTVNAQYQQWYFGQKLGLNFSTGNPVISNIPVGKGPTDIYEAISVVSDNAGNLLFYTDGISVWDATHTVMQGVGGGLDGSSDGGAITGSSVQGAVIMQMPGSTVRYMIISVDCMQDVMAGSSKGMRLTVVDMSLKGGKGDIVASQKNSQLRNGLAANLVGEMIGVVSGDCNTNWIVVHGVGVNGNKFYAYKITSGSTVNNISGGGSPVISTVGPTLAANDQGRGSMVFSHSAVAPNIHKMGLTSQGVGAFLFDFNTSTGVVSNATTISSSNTMFYYGAEFSPDNSKFYFSNYISSGNPSLYQYDLNTTALNSLPNATTDDIGSIRLAPDNKLYCAPRLGSGLSVINSPNSSFAAINFVKDVISFAPATISLGLPEMYVCSSAIPCGDTTLTASIPSVCTSNGSFDLNSYNGTSDAGTWTISNAPLGSTATISSAHIFNINNSVAGNYTVRHTLTTVSPSCPSYSERTFQVYALPVVDLSDQTICSGTTATFDAGAGMNSYNWTGPSSYTSTSQSITVSIPGVYAVTVSNANCSANASALLIVKSLPLVSNLIDQSVCFGESATFDAGAGKVAYHWTGPNGYTDTTQSITVNAAGIYSVTADSNGCTSLAESVDLNIKSLPLVSTLNNQSVCFGESATFDAGAGKAAYHWTGPNGYTNTSQSITVNAAGTYSVTADSNGCTSLTESVDLNIKSLPLVSTLNNQSVCFGESATFDTGAGKAAYHWTGPNGYTNTTQSITVNVAGTYSVTVDSNGCTSLSASVDLTINALPNISVNTVNDLCENTTPEILTANPSGGKWIIDGNIITNIGDPSILTSGQHSAKYYFTDGNNCVDSSALQLFSVFDVDTVDLVDAEYCAGSFYQFSLPNNWDKYWWNNILGTNQFTVNSGSQTVVLRVEDVNGCFTQDSAFVNELEIAIPDLGDNKSICEFENIILSPGTPHDLKYLWSNADTTSQITVDSEGGYKVTVSNDLGCSASDSVFVKKNLLPNISLENDSTICENGYDEIILNAQYQQANSILWSTGTQNTSSIKIKTSGAYWVKIVDSNMCVNADTVVFSALCDDIIFTFPNVFTPNNDGYNDVFHPFGVNDYTFQELMANMINLDFEMYDRWGIKMYESREIIPNWDGRFNGENAPSGTYYFVVKYTNRAGKSRELTGVVTLIR